MPSLKGDDRNDRSTAYAQGKACIKQGVNIMDYISIAEAAEKWHISRRRVQVLCAQGRIQGLERLGKTWAIPSKAKKPEDARLKRNKNCNKTHNI